MADETQGAIDAMKFVADLEARLRVHRLPQVKHADVLSVLTRLYGVIEGQRHNKADGEQANRISCDVRFCFAIRGIGDIKGARSEHPPIHEYTAQSRNRGGPLPGTTTRPASRTDAFAP
jgi:hypothetical protein